MIKTKIKKTVTMKIIKRRKKLFLMMIIIQFIFDCKNDENKYKNKSNDRNVVNTIILITIKIKIEIEIEVNNI